LQCMPSLLGKDGMLKMAFAVHAIFI